MPNPDQSLAGDPTPAGTTPRLGGIEHLSTAAVETILDVDEVMSQARLVERTARICLRGDLQAELESLTEELGDLVDADGRILTEGDQALADQTRAEQILEQRQRVLEQMNQAMRTIRFRALPEDQWREFESAHQDSQGNYKNPQNANRELIAKCAIAPTLTLAQVDGMRKKLGPTQIATMANAAFAACTSGGVDVPKLSLFSPAPRQNSSGRS